MLALGGKLPTACRCPFGWNLPGQGPPELPWLMLKQHARNVHAVALQSQPSSSSHGTGMVARTVLSQSLG